METRPAGRDLVLVGGGHTHALAIRMLAMQPPADTRITLVSPDSLTPYSGMLPGLVAGHYRLEDTHIDLPRLCRWAGVRFVRDRVTAVSAANRRLTLAEQGTLEYDLVSFDIGSTPDLDAVPGAREHAVPVKPVSEFFHRWNRLLDDIRRHGKSRITVIGGGAGGTEMILAVAHALLRHGLEAELQLVCAGDLLAGYPEPARRFMKEQLAGYGIRWHEHRRVTAVDADRIHTDAGELEQDFLLWCTAATGRDWLRESDLDTTSAGFLRVNHRLASISDPRVFAAGDCAWIDDENLPRAGVYAVRQGPVLTYNLRAACEDRALREYHPQQRFLSLLSAGGQRATGNRGSWLFQGAGLWRWKNRIDRRFMERFSDLPERRMPPPATKEHEEPRCAGCGAKVGPEALRRALAEVHPRRREDILAGVDAGEDAAVIRWPSEKLLIQTSDYFPAVIDEPWLFGRIAALHSLSDLHAMNAQPHSAIATVTVPVNHPRLQGRDLERLMAGAVRELDRAGCTLAGGHTLEGPQMAAGFTINGTGDPDKLLHKGGARPGDRLILTKPLGTGLLMAARMRGRCRATWLDAALESMLRDNGEAVAIAVRHGATACTDVTGFGLLGHLLEMCQAGNVGADLTVQEVPVMPGTVELAAAGLASSLKEGNDLALAQTAVPSRFLHHPLLTLLTDPQTGGGLLFAVPPANTRNCVTDLHSVGLNAVDVGVISARKGAEELIHLVE